MSDKNKTPENDASVHEEMEELARIFREELGKAKEAAENEPETDFDNLEVEGYAVTMGEKAEQLTPDELCECCGEKPRGTARDPKSPFCEDCAAIMEKYPYDWKSVVALLAIIIITFFSLGAFVELTPVFSNFYRGNKAADNGKLFTASSYYNSVDNIVAENELDINLGNFKEKRVELLYNLSDFGNAYTYITENYDVNNIGNKKVEKLFNDSVQIRATGLLLSMYYYELGDDYDACIAKFESLIGKKMYIANIGDMSESNVYDETQNYTPTGNEKVVVYNELWIRYYEYLLADQEEKSQDMVKFIGLASDLSSPYNLEIKKSIAESYIYSKQYDKAEEIIKEIGESNQEDISYYTLLAKIYRHRDRNYAAAKDICDTGLRVNEAIRNSEGIASVVPNTVVSFYCERAMDYVMLKDYENAFNALSSCWDYDGSVGIKQVELYAILALANGNNDEYDELMEAVSESEGITLHHYVEDYKNGNISIEEIIMSGRYDWGFE